MRDAPVFKEANHRRHGNSAALSMESETVLLFSARNAFEHEYKRPARAADVDGLVGCIEHQHGHLQHVARLHDNIVPRFAGVRRGPGDGFLLPCMNHYFSQRHPLSLVKKMVGSVMSACLRVARLLPAMSRANRVCSQRLETWRKNP